MKAKFVFPRFLLIGILLLMASHQFGEQLIKPLIPLYQWAINHLDSRLQTSFLGIVKQHGEQFFQQDIILSKPFFIGTEYFEPNSAIVDSATLPLGYVLQPMVMFLTITLAWPAAAIAQYICRIVLGAPLILLVMLLDSPLQFNHMIWNGIQQNINPDTPAASIFLYWCDFLNGGGLIALSLTCGVIAVSGADAVVNFVARRN
jgi:hypothetical protein